MTWTSTCAPGVPAGTTIDSVLLDVRFAATDAEPRRTHRSSALPANTRLLVVTQSPREKIRTDLAALAPAGLGVVLSSDAWRDYGVPGSPHVVSVDGRTGVASRHADAAYP